MERELPIIVIVGPTAVGKTAVSVEVAEHLATEIVSADALQMYRFMDIGTGKPSAQDRARVPHHMVDILDPDERFSAADFAARARAIIDVLHARGMVPLVVGGSGLYVRGIMEGFFLGNGADWVLRKELEEEAAIRGVEHLHRELAKADPEAAARIHPHDLRRIVRALEVLRRSRQPISALQQAHSAAARCYPAAGIGLDRERLELYRRIEERVDAMMAAGWLEEVRALKARGYAADLVAMQAIGYRQLFAHLEGRSSLQDAVQEIKRETRRYAKRQLTWFRHMAGVRWINLSAFRAPAEAVKAVLETLASSSELGEAARRIRATAQVDGRCSGGRP